MGDIRISNLPGSFSANNIAGFGPLVSAAVMFATAALVFWFCHRLNRKKDRK